MPVPRKEEQGTAIFQQKLQEKVNQGRRGVAVVPTAVPPVDMVICNMEFFCNNSFTT